MADVDPEEIDVPSNTQTPSGLYKIWQSESRIWLEGAAALEDLLLDDAIISGPDPTHRSRGEDLKKLKRAPRPFETATLLNRSYVLFDKTTSIDYVVSAKHPRYRRDYTAQCHSVWVRDVGAFPSWKLLSHVHRIIDRKAYLSLTKEHQGERDAAKRTVNI